MKEKQWQEGQAAVMASGPFKENFPDCNVYMLENNDLKKVTPQELKQFCNKNNCNYPYKN